jgi:NAD(P)-dependent dehydrogenase (short-subunit alcohol dehydrogenase family)
MRDRFDPPPHPRRPRPTWRVAITSIPVAGFDAAMAPLVRSVMLGKHAAPIMIRLRSGSIINNGSIAGRRAPYSTSMI